MLIFINLLRRRAAPTLCALLFSLTLECTALGFGKKPIVVPPPPPPPPVENPTDPSDVIRARWETKNRDGASWSKHVFDTLPVLAPNLLASKAPADITEFCPAYGDLSLRDKKNFWVYLLSTMTELESGHDPSVKYTEIFTDNSGKRVVSRGLLQISIESANGGYACGFTNEEQLHDPLRNLDCGLKILNKWVGKDGRLSGYLAPNWLGGARYWSVLRKDPNLGKIKAWNNALRMCAQ